MHPIKASSRCAKNLIVVLGTWLALAPGLTGRAADANLADEQAALIAHEAKMKWFRDAKFGLFIHWGLYCIPAGEWKGQRIPGIGEWIMNRARIPVKEYEQLANQFDPVK